MDFRRKLRFAAMLFSVLLIAVAFSTRAAAEKRVALVIGNGNYIATSALPNPSNDARAIAEALRNIGFEVLLGMDTSMAELRNLVQEFGSRLDGAGMAMFFYAGHGFQLQGQNFVVPVDADIKEETDIEFETLDLDMILRQMDRRAAVKLVLLDACRNNPFESILTRSMGRARTAAVLGRGLAPVQASGGTLIGFATDPGNVAYDGDGSNSPFTEALLRHIETPGLEINVMMTRVRADVFRKTGQRQRPWTTSSLIGEVYLNGTQSATDPVSAEIDAWKAAESAASAESFEAYLAAYPDGLFADLARLRIVGIESGNVPRLSPGVGGAEPANVPQASDPGRDAAQVERFVDCASCPKMVVLPAGSFRMGEDFGPEWEKPRKYKTIPAPFAMGRAEVTRAQWAACAAEGPCRKLPGPADDVAASGIGWKDAQDYVEWLSGITQRQYRLPSETEWEYAARGGSGARFPSGPVIRPEDANFGQPDGAPIKAGSHAPNGFGLSELAGNVWEWVADCGAFYSATGNGSGPVVATPCIRLLRGGGFRSSSHELRSANRYFHRSDEGRDDFGLRVAADVKR